MDKLEKKIQSNREELDTVEQPAIDALWQGIRQEIDRPKYAKKINLVRWWAVAASVALLILAASTVLMWKQLNEKGSTTEYNLAMISEELGEKEKSYQRLVNEKKRVVDFESLQPEDFKDTFEELEILEALYQEYAQQIPLYGNNERLINTILKYYELKIRILEQLENELIKKRHYEEYEEEIHI